MTGQWLPRMISCRLALSPILINSYNFKRPTIYNKGSLLGSSFKQIFE